VAHSRPISFTRSDEDVASPTGLACKGEATSSSLIQINRAQSAASFDIFG